MYKWTLLACLAFCLAGENDTNAAAPSSARTAELGSKWQVLVGEWKADAISGGGSGGCAFRFDATQRALIRTNWAELPGQSGKPATVHTDSMVIRLAEPEAQAQATYRDNEGHVIEYTGSWSADGNVLTFVSKTGTGPRFRLIYQKVDANTMTVSFEMAPPGGTGAFKPYTSGRIRRTSNR